MTLPPLHPIGQQLARGGRWKSLGCPHNGAGPRRRTPLMPGEPVDVRFSLTALPVPLRTGEHLQLDVGSRSDVLREDPADGFVQFDVPVPPYLCRSTLHFGGQSGIDVDQIPVAPRLALGNRIRS